MAVVEEEQVLERVRLLCLHIQFRFVITITVATTFPDYSRRRWSRWFFRNTQAEVAKKGSNSVFSTITSTGGGGGLSESTTGWFNSALNFSGGQGGGSSQQQSHGTSGNTRNTNSHKVMIRRKTKIRRGLVVEVLEELLWRI